MLWTNFEPYFLPLKSVVKQLQHLQQSNDDDQSQSINPSILANFVDIRQSKFQSPKKFVKNSSSSRLRLPAPGSLCFAKTPKDSLNSNNPYWPCMVLDQNDLSFRVPKGSVGLLWLGEQQDRCSSHTTADRIVSWQDAEKKQFSRNGGVKKKMSKSKARKWKAALKDAHFIDQHGRFEEDPINDDDDDKVAGEGQRTIQHSTSMLLSDNLTLEKRDDAELRELEAYVSSLPSSESNEMPRTSIKILMTTFDGKAVELLVGRVDGEGGRLRSSAAGRLLQYQELGTSPNLTTQLLCHTNVSEQALEHALSSTQACNLLRLERLQVRLDAAVEAAAEAAAEAAVETNSSRRREEQAESKCFRTTGLDTTRMPGKRKYKIIASAEPDLFAALDIDGVTVSPLYNVDQVTVDQEEEFKFKRNRFTKSKNELDWVNEEFAARGGWVNTQRIDVSNTNTDFDTMTIGKKMSTYMLQGKEFQTQVEIYRYLASMRDESSPEELENKNKFLGAGTSSTCSHEIHMNANISATIDRNMMNEAGKTPLDLALSFFEPYANGPRPRKRSRQNL
jgi:hypothetical protein